MDDSGKISGKETKCAYYLQLVDNDTKHPEGTWEEVSEYIYENHHKVFLDDGKKRYNGNKAKRNAAGIISITADNMTDRDYAILLRMFGINVNVSMEKHYLKKPEYLKVLERKKIVLHEVATGNNYAMKVVGKAETDGD